MCFSNDDLPSRFLLLAQIRFPTARICPCLGIFACSFAVVRLLFHLTVLIFCFTCDLVLEFFYVLLRTVYRIEKKPQLQTLYRGWVLFSLVNRTGRYMVLKTLIFPSSLGGVKTLRPVNMENDQLRPTCTLFLS